MAKRTSLYPFGLTLALACGTSSSTSPPAPTLDPEVASAPAPAPANHYPRITTPGAFEPPGSDQRRAAIGSLEGLRGPARRVFEEGEGSFYPIARPEPGDWLAEHDEVYETFARYRQERAAHLDDTRDTIYLVEIGAFDPASSPPVEALARYSSAFFGMPVKRLPPIEVAALDITSREHDGHTQLYAREILERLRDRRPRDAFALAAVTMVDLYPDEDWNFVFGYASPRGRVGVFSFARYDPAFFERARGPEFRATLLARSAKTLSHELGHMFGVSHCTHYACVMNGHNHDAEGAAAPMHLCPVDLRKLQHSVGFDPIARYEALLALDRELGFNDEARWIERRLAWIRGGP